MAPNYRLRHRLEQLWIVATLAYSIGRILVARHFFAKYGVNIWIFGAIDIVTSGPYGLATARVVLCLIDHNYDAATKWTALAATMFIAPDLYVVASGRGMPIHVYVVLGLWVSLMAVLAVRQVRNKVRARHLSAGATSRSPDRN